MVRGGHTVGWLYKIKKELAELSGYYTKHSLPVFAIQSLVIVMLLYPPQSFFGFPRGFFNHSYRENLKFSGFCTRSR